MTLSWYCTDCEARIDSSEVSEHEAAGHAVRGHLRPDRLLPSDPALLEADIETENG